MSKKLKFYYSVGFKNVPVFETTPTKSSNFPMSTHGTSAGRAACIRIMQGGTHIFIVVTSTMMTTSGI